MNLFSFSKTKIGAIQGIKTKIEERVLEADIHPKPIIYFSYSEHDKNFVEYILNNVENERFEFIMGNNIDKRFGENPSKSKLIERSNAFVIFLSLDYLSSKSCEYEVHLIKRSIKDNQRIIIALMNKTSLYQIWKRFKEFADFTSDQGLDGVQYIKDRLNYLFP